MPAVPVPVIPRAASSGSSPKPTRHLMAGAFRSYFTIDVNGGLIRLPTVLYSLITGRSNGPTPSGYGGSAPRPRAAGASGRVQTEPAPAISSGGAPEPSGAAPRPPRVAVNIPTSASTSAAARCGIAGFLLLPTATTARIAAASTRDAPAAMFFAGSAVAKTSG